MQEHERVMDVWRLCMQWGPRVEPLVGEGQSLPEAEHYLAIA